MTRLAKKWELPEHDWHKQSLLAKSLDISPVTARVLLNRGIGSPEEARIFLDGSLEDLTSPWDLPGMHAAVERIVEGMQTGEKIIVYGDYDVDGITATALLISFFREIGVAADYYLPERSDGYGLSTDALDVIAGRGCDLVITVDCGISAAPEITYGRTLGLDFVVTDHHEPGEKVPACPVVNPKLAPHSHQAGELAGVGVAFKLAQALACRLGMAAGPLRGYLDLVALGTIADVVPLIKDNRLLVRHGLVQLRNSRRPGLAALCETAGIKQEELTTGQVAFGLAPRLNAAGRMASPVTALELLLTDSVQKARELALKLQELNTARQLLAQQVQNEAETMAKGAPPVEEAPVLVLASPFWHPGVIGIVAAKLAEKYFRPVILLTVEGELAKGSGRSIAGFDLFKALSSCGDLLLTAGGHSQAVGLTLEADRIDHLRQRINTAGASLLKEGFPQPCLQLDAEVLPDQLDLGLAEELSQLEPFGPGNPEPLFVLRNACLKDCRRVGKEGNHLKFRVQGEAVDLDGIGFKLAPALEEEIDPAGPVDLVFRLEQNRWNGQVNVQLVLEDLKEHVCTVTGLKEEPLPALSPRITLPWPPDSQRFCSNGREQLETIRELVLAAKEYGRSVCLLFPSQRLLAVYEKLLSDSLIKYNVTCRRLNRQVSGETFQITGDLVFLAVDGTGMPPVEMPVIRLVFPRLEGENRPPGVPPAFLLGFKDLEPPGYRFVRQPVVPRDKLAYIEALVRQAEGPVFIYSNKKKQVLELYHGLRQLFPRKKRNIWYYHHGLCLSQKELVLAAVAHGQAEVLVAAEFVELLLPDFGGKRTRVIVDAPYSCDELFLKSRPHGNPTTVHGIWHLMELAANEAVLDTIFPEDRLLETLLAAVTELGVTREEGLPAVIRGLKDKGNNVQQVALQYVMDILAEGVADYRSTAVYRAAAEEKKALTMLRELDLAGSPDYTSLMLRGAP